MQGKLIIIGGTAAGLSAASAAKRLNSELSVTVYEKTGYISYGSCGLPYFIGGIVRTAEDLVTFTPEQISSSRGIEVRIHHEVTDIDRATKTVSVRNMDTGEEFSDRYDQLVLATGASAIIPPIKGSDKDRVFTIRHVEDGIAIRNALAEKHSKVVIIGAGFIGLEMAAELTAAGHSVVLFEALPRILPALPEEYSAAVLEELQNNKVTVCMGTTVDEITGDGRANGVLAGGCAYEADAVIMCVGVRPNGELARESGIAVTARNAIQVDKHMRTSDESIYACGDCIETFCAIDGSPVYIPLGTSANKQGKVAGQNIGGKPSAFWGVLGSQITKVFDLYIGTVGYSLAEAMKNGFDAASCTIQKNDRASYYPQGGMNRITLIFEKGTGRILGMQAIGAATISGRLNVIATAIKAKMTVDELNQVDFVYSPPVAPVYDPLLIAASQSKKHVGGK